MSAIFPPWSTAAFRWVLVLVAALLLAVPIALMGWVRTPYVTGELVPIEQPVPFDHRHHVVDDGIDCRYCHLTVERSPTAGLPSTEVCMGCHSQIWNDSPLLEPVRQSFFESRPIAWQRVHRLPDFVFFNHAIHVAKGIGCESCHGRVDRMPRILQVVPLTMGWCLECHRDPVSHLRPREAITAMGWRPESDAAALRAVLAKRYQVSPSTDCSSCHR
ncbi:MAG TPA: cytochrome c3 family protein [Planctomycetota bacterium]|nr:cytochrome c3 family protein [Planctomycetota bacterium]